MLLANSLFGLDSNYFSKNKNIDVLYVNSLEGLRVREEPSLSAKKISVLYDRMIVKVVSVGKETKIDGIKSNWVQILLPIETVQAERDVYGWVFGGYLSDKLEPFSTKNWSNADLQKYLSRFSWTSDIRSYYLFSPDGEYFYGRLESGGGGHGNYSVSMKDMKIILHVSYGDEEYEGPVETEILKIKNIKEDSLLLEINGAERELLPAFTNSYFWSNACGPKMSISDFDEPAMNALRFSIASNMINNLPIDDKNNLYSNLIKMGIKLTSPDYLTKYNEYWMGR